MRAGNPWNAIFSFAYFNQRCKDSFSGNIFDITSSVTAMSFGSPLNAAHRNGPLPSQNNGLIYAGTKPGKAKHLPGLTLNAECSALNAFGVPRSAFSFCSYSCA